MVGSVLWIYIYYLLHIPQLCGKGVIVTLSERKLSLKEVSLFRLPKCTAKIQIQICSWLWCVVISYSVPMSYIKTVNILDTFLSSCPVHSLPVLLHFTSCHRPVLCCRGSHSLRILEKQCRVEKGHCIRQLVLVQERDLLSGSWQFITIW